jgi:hypothetical protein
MDESFVKGKLIEVLKIVQELSNESCPPLTDDVRPAINLPEFTSKVWPVAAGMLGIALGKHIPCDVNIFVDESTNEPLSIAQSVKLVHALIKAGEIAETVVAAE